MQYSHVLVDYQTQYDEVTTSTSETQLFYTLPPLPSLMLGVQLHQPTGIIKNVRL